MPILYSQTHRTNKFVHPNRVNPRETTSKTPRWEIAVGIWRRDRRPKAARVGLKKSNSFRAPWDNRNSFQVGSSLQNGWLGGSRKRQKNSQEWVGLVTKTGWWFHFKYFWNFHPDPWGNDPIWRAYFSNGLKPPTRWVIVEKPWLVGWVIYVIYS